jgi:hypothetical protein
MSIDQLMEEMLLYTQCKVEIAALAGRHGNAPKYLHEQAGEHLANVRAIAAQLDLLLFPNRGGV